MDEVTLKKLEEIEVLNKKKTLLHDEIEKYGKDLDSIQEAISEAKKVELDIENLKKELSTLTISKNDLIAIQAEVNTLEIKKTNILSEIDQHTTSLNGMGSKIKESNDLQSKFSNLNSEITREESRKATLLNNLTEIENKISIGNAKITSLEGSFLDKKNTLEKEHSKRKDELESIKSILEGTLSTKQKEADDLDKVIKEKKIEISSLLDKISSLTLELKNLDNLIKAKIAANENEISQKNEVLNERQTALDGREGNLSLRESTLEQKRTSLIAMKSRLEKESGKTINIEI